MSANFTPTFNEYTEQHPFRFWCQTVLPSVYDDSLSYYELLNKVVEQLNVVISNETNLEGNVQGLLTAYNQLQEYVNTYFDNLDVQAEIDAKLDKMVTDGTFDTIINDTLFEDIRAAIMTNSSAITSLSNTKIGENDTDYVGMAQLKQEVKTALTGGSTAVVAANSVNTINIVDGAVTKDKIKNSVKPVFLNPYPSNSSITINTNSRTITFSSPYFIIAGGASINIANNTVGYPNDLGTYWIVYDTSTSAVAVKSTRGVDDIILGFIFNGEISFVSDANVIYTPTPNSSLTDVKPTTNSEVYFNSRIIFNLNDRVITFDRTANIYLSLCGYYKVINTTNSAGAGYQEDIDISGATSGIQNTGVLCFDKTTELLTAVASNTALSTNLIPIGFFNIGFNFVYSTLPYTTICSQTNLYDTEDEIPIFGDSITAGANSTKPFVKVVNQLKGYRLLNYGIGSTSYTVNLTEGTSHISGNGTPEQGTSQSVSALNTITERVKAYVQDTNNSDKKIVFLYGGYNDFHFQNLIPGSTTADKIGYFSDKVNEAIEACLNNGKRVGVVGVLRSYEGESTYNIPLSTFNEVLKNKAEYYGVPFLDLWNCGLDPNISSIRSLYFNDGVHPNNRGSAKLGIMFTNFIEQWFCCKHTN